ncbi:hypothetical protein NDU88_002364 [Pleurodeles waltl]|uniref:Uncharacterized protein n=1 Tax=Pleurodeles waltl TaxID=8319 RepID=A0AAV7KS03_PLEWA|nr:hypothetical protein NDU88_002364 [Pleurodeles waltl]
MVKGRQPKSLQANKLDRYAVKMTSGEQLWDQSDETPEVSIAQSGEPSLRSIMAAIQDLQGLVSPIEPKLDAVTLEVNLLREDFGNISEKVAVAETHFEGLLSTTKSVKGNACQGGEIYDAVYATLRVVADKETWHFASPDEAWDDWLEGWRVAGKDLETSTCLELLKEELRALWPNRESDR